MSDDNKPAPVFVDGLFIKDIPDTTPEYILADYSINISKFKAWLDANQDKAVKGWLNITVKKSQAGKKYAQLNTYQPQNTSLEAQNAPVTNELSIAQQNDHEDINVEDIPF